MIPVVSQPQLYLMNSIIRGQRDTANLNYEIYATSYDIANLYYKQSVIQAEYLADVNYFDTGSALAPKAPDDLPFNSGTLTILSSDALLTSLSALNRRVDILEFGLVSNI